uniref:Putative tail protein n=1 Tax=viral metagenome TaxID=1070528 RepID=A0A6M3KRS6_9ZZZZ
MSKILLTEAVAPSTPAAGKVAVYAKTDGLLYQKDDAGVEFGLTPLVAIAKYYDHDQTWVRKTGDNSVIQSPNEIMLRIGNNSYFLSAQIELDVDTAGDWDTVVGTDYSVAANRAGKDFYVYAVQPVSGSVPDFCLSANSTVPDGYTADNSRKVAGFHCLCVAAGTIAGHTLTGYLQGDILPASVWDLYHRPIASSEGMVYSEQAGLWVDIYLASGTGVSTASANGGTISDTRNWMDFVDDFAAVKKMLLDDIEFQIIAAGSNEETNIAGSADPGTTGGHSDTAARRMVSNIGCEDCCGAMWQWLKDHSYRMDGVDLAASQAWAYYDLPGAKGSLYKQGTYGDVKLLAGGYWTAAAYSGSRSRYAAHYRWAAYTAVGGRGRSEPRANRF